MALKLSKGQIEAVNEKNKNILVSAAAGSGKTFVLTQRVLTRIIEDRWNIDSFLIVTFTRDAAAEMRGRIVKSIEEKLTEVIDSGDSELVNHLERQLILINKADISTIDAFCSNVVRRNFHKTELDSGYKNPTSVEANNMRKEAVDLALEEIIGEEDKGFLSLYKGYVGKANDDAVVDMIYSLYNFADSMPYPEKWLDSCVEMYESPSFFESIWGRVYYDKIGKSVSRARLYFNKAMDIVFMDNVLLPDCVTELKYILEKFEGYCESGDFESISKIEIKLRFDLRKIKNNYSEEELGLFKRYLNFTRDELNNALSLVKVSKEDIDYLYKQSKPEVLALVRATKKFMKHFHNIKIDNQLAEFNDVAHYCLNILRDEDGNTTDIAKEYQKKYNEVIIDEYQDSNHLQEAILTAVSRCEQGKNNIFMVGDIKQAIYRFRQTTPKLFIDKYERYGKSIKDEKLILLSENYRSRAVVLEACNLVFKQIMDKELGEVDYTEEVYLNPKADFPIPNEETNISKSTELLTVDIANVKSGDADCDIDSKTGEARLIAKRIHEMLYTKPLYIYDSDIEKYRVVKKSDIVILVNKRGNAGVIFDELNSVGLSCVFEVSNPLFKATEVKNIISLLRLIDNPLQDIDIVNVLHSPMYCMSFDDITRIRINDRKCNIFTAVKEYIENEDDISNKLKKFVEDLEYYRDYGINNSIGELVDEIYTKSNYFNYVGINENGDFRQANLRLFKEKALEFEKYGPSDLHSFIEFIDTDLSDEIREVDKVGTATNLIENEDAIRIMTMHKSKGLEFPVVFVSQLHNQFNVMYKSNNYIFDRELGIGLKYIDKENRLKFTPLVYDIIIGKYANEEISEDLRLLYVALTRAKEKLIITGVINSNDKSSGKMAMINEIENDKNMVLPYNLRAAAGNMLFWILAAVKRKNFDTKNSIVQINTPLESITSLDELTTENAVNTLDKIDNIEKEDITGEYKSIIEDRLNYEYPYKDKTLLPSKISITEIKRKINNDDSDTEKYFGEATISGEPKILKGAEHISAAQRGTLYHTVMEHIDFRKVKSKEDILELVDYLRDSGIISSEEKKVINCDKFLEFVNTPLYNRISNADAIYKEAPFVMSIKANRLKEYKNSDADLVVHGIIDLYFKDSKGIVIVDYKTDKVFKSIYELVDRYKVQLELYKEAVERNTGEKVTECIIYSIDKGEAVNV